MAEIDNKYHELLQHILDNGRLQDDPNRKGVKRLNIPRYNFEYDLQDGFPAITTKKLYWKGVIGELLWFLRGDTSIKYLIDNNINIWNKDAYNFYVKNHKTTSASYGVWLSELKHGSNVTGNCGRIYGAQWRKWTTIYDNPLSGMPEPLDQIDNLIKNLKENPLATDHIVTAWNPAEKDQMALPPCHKGFQLMVYELSPLECTKYADKSKIPYKGPKYGFDLVWEQRSVDTFLGLPFNIASYALLAHIIGEMVNMIPGKIYGDLRNVHIYNNHLDAVKEQLSRDVNKYKECDLNISTKAISELKDGLKYIDNEWINIRNFLLLGYKSYDSIKAEMLSRDK